LAVDEHLDEEALVFRASGRFRTAIPERAPGADLAEMTKAHPGDIRSSGSRQESIELGEHEETLVSFGREEGHFKNVF
jgi:hypothetical protein